MIIIMFAILASCLSGVIYLAIGKYSTKKKVIYGSLIGIVMYTAIGEIRWYHNHNANSSSIREEQETELHNYVNNGSKNNIDANKSKENKARIKSLSAHSWKLMHGDVYRTCLVEVVRFNENGNGTLAANQYAGGNLINQSSPYSFSYRIDGDKVYIEGDYTYKFDGYTLVDMQGNEWQKGSSLFY